MVVSCLKREVGGGASLAGVAPLELQGVEVSRRMLTPRTVRGSLCFLVDSRSGCWKRG